MSPKPDTSATLALNLAMLLFGSILAPIGLLFTMLGILAVVTGHASGHGGGFDLLISGVPSLFIGAWIARSGLKRIKQRQAQKPNDLD